LRAQILGLLTECDFAVNLAAAGLAGHVGRTLGTFAALILSAGRASAISAGLAMTEATLILAMIAQK
jgi:hypothetical protein